MAKKRSKKKKSVQNRGGAEFIIKKLIIASLIGVILFFIMIAVAALIFYKADTDPEYFPVTAVIISGITGLFCGFFTVLPVKQNGIFLGMAGIIPAFIIIFAVASVISKTAISVTGWAALGAMTAGGAAGGIIANKK